MLLIKSTKICLNNIVLPILNTDAEEGVSKYMIFLNDIVRQPYLSLDSRTLMGQEPKLARNGMVLLEHLTMVRHLGRRSIKKSL